MPLTRARLQELLKYNQRTGEFTWLQDRPHRSAGSLAGCFDTSTGYTRIGVDGALYLAHRLAFLYVTGRYPRNETDHKNGDRVDNRWCNLRRATTGTNKLNQCLYSSNTSGFNGVLWNERRKRWIAFARLKYKHYHLGSFIEFEDAKSARVKFNRENGFTKRHGVSA